MLARALEDLAALIDLAQLSPRLNQMQSMQAAAVAQQAANDQIRIRLETQIAINSGMIAVLQGTVSSIIAVHSRE